MQQLRQSNRLLKDLSSSLLHYLPNHNESKANENFNLKEKINRTLQLYQQKNTEINRQKLVTSRKKQHPSLTRHKNATKTHVPPYYLQLRNSDNVV